MTKQELDSKIQLLMNEYLRNKDYRKEFLKQDYQVVVRIRYGGENV